MRTFTVHEPPGSQGDRLERAEALVFVKDGFSWPAAILTPFWMIANRLWLALLFYLGGLALAQGAVWATGLAQQPASWLMLGLHLVIGFEADAIRRWALRRRGYAMIGSVSGPTTEDCERRFFDDWLKGQPFVPASALASTTATGGRLGGLMLPLRRG
jgi:hypothetical protein